MKTKFYTTFKSTKSKNFVLTLGPTVSYDKYDKEFNIHFLFFGINIIFES